MYCLWLNGKKVYTLQHLRDSFDAEAVELYCLGGGLSRWLKDCGEEDIAAKVEQLDLSKNIPIQLAEIFNVDLPEKEEPTQEPVSTQKSPVPSAGTSFTHPPYSIFDTSFSPGSFFTSFSTTSFSFSTTYTSFFTTSFLTTSFSGHEYEYEIGSFTTNSFSLYLSSFFAETSLFAGSFTLGSFTAENSSFTPLSDSFHPTPSSFTTESPPAPLTPRQKFELNLSSCPLNRYGYGIHLI